MSAPSIRRTLLIRCGIGVGALLCLLCASVYLIVRQGLYRELDESIEQTASLLANQVELEDDSINFEWQEGIGTNRSLIAEGLFQFWVENSSITSRSPALQSRDLPRFTGIDGHPMLRDILLPDGHYGRAIGLRIYPFVLADEIARMEERGRMLDTKSFPLVLVVARDAEPVHRTLEQLRWALGGGTFLTLGMGFLLIHRVVRVTLRPIDDLTAQVKDRSEQQLDSALDLPGELPAELAGLAENFDSLLARVAAIRQREKDFIRHAAHELRTPISGLRATTDLALSQQRDADAYAGHLATCQKTAVELGDLVKRLSALSRIGQSTTPPARVPVDLSALLDACAEAFTHPLEERGLVVRRGFPEKPVMAAGDPTLFRIIFNNLLDNVVSYATAGSTVELVATVAENFAEITVANHTDDPPENPDRLFEPLFRRDSSRTDAGSHLGIGLTLCQEAAKSMGATLKAGVTGGNTIRFTLRTRAHPH